MATSTSSRFLVLWLLVCPVAGQDLFLAKQENGTQSAAAAPDKLMQDLYRFWDAFRDPGTGAYCDSISFANDDVCDGTKAFYSSAGTGMGLILECVFVELGLQSRSEGSEKVTQTLKAVRDFWPKEQYHGFHAHFVQIKQGTWTNLGEWSTIDSAELFMGALFAGNYFGDAVDDLAQSLASAVKWSDALEAADSPVVFPIANGTTAQMHGVIKPYNEYYIVAYLAKLMDPNPSSKASRYFETYHGSSGAPVGGADGHPVHRNYWGYDLLTDGDKFMSSFIPQFCWFQTKGFQENAYYSKQLLKAWLQADLKFWDLITSESTEIWGKKVKGKIFGCGAGPGHDSGYTVNRIDGKEEPIFSAAIMAGFLSVDDADMRRSINEQLQWLVDNSVCVYDKHLPDGYTASVPWRCSISNPDWKASTADSIDYSTMVLGYALNFLPDSFYQKFAA